MPPGGRCASGGRGWAWRTSPTSPGGLSARRHVQITPQMRIVVAVDPQDFRKGIDGLARICREVPRLDSIDEENGGQNGGQRRARGRRPMWCSCRDHSDRPDLFASANATGRLTPDRAFLPRSQHQFYSAYTEREMASTKRRCGLASRLEPCVQFYPPLTTDLAAQPYLVCGTPAGEV